MSFVLKARQAVRAAGLVVLAQAIPLSLAAYLPQGGEYSLIGSLPGDQVFPSVAVNADGGYVVWHDAATDGDGLGIGARRLNSSLSGSLATFRVNETALGDQEYPQVALLKDGGAVVVWQGGKGAVRRIYARFLRADGTFASGDVQVNTYSKENQIDPAVATLSDGNVVVVWSSYGQDGVPVQQSLYGVYGQILSPTGQKIGGEFAVNQTWQLNQRSATVAALPSGQFVVAWISEKLRGFVNTTGPNGVDNDGTGSLGLYDVNVMGRTFNAQALPLQGEFQINSSRTTCANPSVASTTDGAFLVAWSGKPFVNPFGGVRSTNGWDIFGRAFGPDLAPRGEDARFNGFTYGDQYRPRAASLDDGYTVVWTTLQQDGDREGIAGRSVSAAGLPEGEELHLNTTIISQQIYPAIASDGSQRLLAVWSSFVGGVSSFDLFGRRLASSQILVPPPAPFVSALSQSRLSVAWPEVGGYDIEHYELFVDGQAQPVVVKGILWTATGLLPGSSHTFKLAYRLKNGNRSPLSEAGEGRTWGEDENFDGLPDDWQAAHWGANPVTWGNANADDDDDGASNVQEFLAGTNPTDASSVLRTSILPTAGGGYLLSWNTQPGLVYQVQRSEAFQSWSDEGLARFAPGTIDSVGISTSGEVSLYRVIRLR